MRTIRLSNDPNANDIPDDIVVDDAHLLQAFHTSIPQPFEPADYHASYLPSANYDWTTVFPGLGQSAGVPAGRGTPQQEEWGSWQPTDWQSPEQLAKPVTRGSNQAWIGVVFLILFLLLFPW